MLGRWQAQGPHHPVAEWWCRPAYETLQATIIDSDYDEFRMNQSGDAETPSVGPAKTRDEADEDNSKRVLEDPLIHAPGCQMTDDVAVRHG